MEALHQKLEAIIHQPPKASHPYLLDFQKVGVDLALKYSRFLLADDMGCIDGNALISINRGKASRKVKMEYLYRRFKGELRGKEAECWNDEIGVFARSLHPNGTFRLNKIINVIDSGIKKVVKISTKLGKQLILTPDHLVKTKGGWEKAENLKVGDIVLTNGKEASVCILCGSINNIISNKYSKFKDYCKQCMYRRLRKNGNEKDNPKTIIRSNQKYIIKSLRYHPYWRHSGMIEHRLVYEAKMNGLTLNQWLDKLKNNDIVGCKFLDPKMHVHHINGNSLDNRPENLIELTHAEHLVIHNGYKNRSKAFIPKEDTIELIEEAGESHVYDIVMNEPSRNFVANGIVVHNCGKTIQAISWADTLLKEGKVDNIVVICPKSIRQQWASEIEKFAKIQAKISKSIDSDVFTVIHYEAIRKLKPQFGERTALIIDEMSKLKNSKTQIYGVVSSVIVRCNFVLGLTGTPVENSLINFYNILKLLHPKWMYWKEFASEHIVWEEVWTGSKYVTSITGFKNLDKFRTRASNIYIRRTKNQISELLPKNYQIRNISLPAKVAQVENFLYEEITGPEERFGLIQTLRFFMSEPSNIVASGSETAENIVSIFGTDFPSTKLSELLSVIDETDSKLIVFTHFASTAKFLEKQISGSICIVGGEDDKEEKLKRFKDGDTKVLISTDTMSYGVNIDQADIVVHYDLPWNPGVLRQREDRIHRVNSTRQKTIITLLTDSKIEQRIFEVLRGKMDLSDKSVIEDTSLIKEVFKR